MSDMENLRKGGLWLAFNRSFSILEETFEQLEEFAGGGGNPNHDARGRFAPSPGGKVDEYRTPGAVAITPKVAAERAAIGKEIQAARVKSGKKPYSAATLKAYAAKQHTQEQGMKKGYVPTKAEAPKAKTVTVEKVPGGGEVVRPKAAPRSPKQQPIERIGTMQERIKARAAAEAEKIKARQAAEIEAIRKQHGEGKTYSEILGNKPTPAELEHKSILAARDAKRAAELHGAMSPEHMKAMKEATAAEVAYMQAKQEHAKASGAPSEVKISETGVAMHPDIRNGVQEAREAMRGAGLVGDYGTVEVKKDEPRKSRYGAYYPGFNRIVINDSSGVNALPNKRGDGAFTFTHEYGHHIDHFSGRRTGEGDHSKTPEFTKAVRSTQAYKDLQVQKKSNGTYLPELVARNVPFRDRRRSTYLSTPTELFARAYAQWVTEKAGSSHMKDVLERRRGDHWEEKDFAPLRAYFEKNFGGKK